MPVPARFFIGLLSGICGSFALFFALLFGQVGTPSVASVWAVQIGARKLAAGRALSSPKLLLVGGSGTLFGIKARQLESALGLPTLNLASHAALGTAILLDLPRQVAAAGDTIVLVPEYELYDYGEATRRDWAESLYLDYLMAADPARFHRLPLTDLVPLGLRVSTGRLAEGWHNRFTPLPPRNFPNYYAYDAAHVDDHGDMTGHTSDRIPEESRGPLGKSESLAGGLSPARSGMSELAAFCTWAKAHNIRVIAARPVLCDHPAYHEPTTARTVAEVEDFWRAQGIPLLGRFSDTLLPRSEFFDTFYHLTETSAAVRTANLATELAPYFRAGQTSR